MRRGEQTLNLPQGPALGFWQKEEGGEALEEAEGTEEQEGACEGDSIHEGKDASIDESRAAEGDGGGTADG